MFKTGFSAVAPVIVFLATIARVMSQDPPRSGTYQIQSGSYREDGGFIASVTYELPSSRHAFVRLMIGHAGDAAELSFLDQEQHAVFPHLTNGIVVGNTIQFQYVTEHPYGLGGIPAWVDYTVANTAGYLWISGSITSAPVCCDIPYLFEHRDVGAAFLPSLTIRGGRELQLSWESASNQTYQVQCLTDLAEFGWSNLGPPVPGNGTTNYVLDTVEPGNRQKFYRIVTLP